MAKTAEIKTKLTGDATGLRRELDVSRSDVARYARDVTARLKAIQAAVQSINIVASVAGFVGIAKQAISVYNDLRKWIRGTSEEAEKAAAAATEAARKMRDEAGEGVGIALYDALREQAEAAGVAADALSAKLREFREHKITFDELAASVGATRDALAGAESAAAGRTVGTRYLAERGDAEAARKAREDAANTEREGIRAIVREIYARGDRFGRGAATDDLWDRLLEAAGGDAARAGELYNENRGWTNFRAVGVGMYGDEALRAASGRRAARQAAAEAAREAGRQAHDAEVRAQREAAAKEEEDRQRRENERAAAAAEAERQRAEAQRQREEAAAQAKADKIEKLEGRVIEARWRGQRAEDAVRVSAPQAINSLNTIGGLIGSDPTALNAARMEAERTAAVNAIRESTAAAVRALEEEIRILREG